CRARSRGALRRRWSACDEHGGCPTGYQCQTVETVTQESVHQCIPTTFCEALLYCAPCTRDADCSGGVCFAVSGSGNRCVPHCDILSSCPSGSSCQVSGTTFVCEPSSTCP